MIQSLVALEVDAPFVFENVPLGAHVGRILQRAQNFDDAASAATGWPVDSVWARWIAQGASSHAARFSHAVNA